MKQSILLRVILILVVLTFGCADDKQESAESTESLAVNAPLQMHVPDGFTGLDDDEDYDVIIRDDDGWDIKLICDRNSYYRQGFYGVLEYTSGNEIISGPACAQYVRNQNMVLIISYDEGWNEYLSYTFKFDDPASGTDMTGQWLFLDEGDFWGGSIGADLIQGSLGDHNAATAESITGPVVARKNAKSQKESMRLK